MSVLGPGSQYPDRIFNIGLNDFQLKSHHNNENCYFTNVFNSYNNSPNFKRKIMSIPKVLFKSVKCAVYHLKSLLTYNKIISTSD